MPTIPILQESKRLNVGNPVPIASSAQDRVAGESLESFGAGVQKLGAGYLELEQKRKSIRQKLEADEFANEAERLAQALVDDIRRTGKPNGEDWNKDYQEAFGKTVEGMAERFGDDLETRQLALNAANQHRDQYAKGLYDESFKAFSVYGKQQMEKGINARAAQVMKNPALFDRAYGEQMAFFDSPEARSLAHPAEIEAMKKVAGLTMAENAIRGLKESRRYDTARRALTDKFGQFFDADKMAALHNELDNEERQWKNDKWSDRERAYTLAQRQLTTQRDTALRAYMESAASAKTPSAVEQVRNNARAAYSAGLLTEEGLGLIQKTIEGDQTQRWEGRTTNYFDLITRATDDQQLDRLQRNIVADVGVNKTIGAKDGQELIRFIDSEKQRRKSDPTYRLKKEASDELMDAHFGKENFLSQFVNRERLVLKAQARVEVNRMILAGSDPIEAAQSVIKRLLPSAESMPMIPRIPYALQRDPGGVQEIGKRLKAQYEAGEIGVMEYMTYMNMMDGLAKSFERADWKDLPKEKNPNVTITTGGK
jgi:hypothetical protein